MNKKTDLLFSYHSEGKYDHPTSSDGCQEYQEFCDKKAITYGHSFHLLLPAFYLDEYESNTTRHQSYLGIYFILMNQTKEVLLYSYISLSFTILLNNSVYTGVEKGKESNPSCYCTTWR